MMLPSIKKTKKARSTTAATASPRGTLWFWSIRTGGASMKLRMQASAMGSSTSRAKYRVATTMTDISMALSVEDDELTADPPMTLWWTSDARTSSEPHRSPSGADPHRLHASSG